jgi:parallel beta-helix repeat protein
MKIIPFFITLIIATASFAQTHIADKQEVWGKWTKSGSPYIVEGEAIVPIGKTLTIKPGTVIMFKTGEDRDYRIDNEINSGFDVGFLRVKGTLKAIGKKSKIISFTKNGEGNWGNVFFEESKSNILTFCNFESSFYMRGVTENDNGTGAVSFWKSEGTIENCIFSNNGWAAINCKQSSTPTIKNTTITMNKYGVESNSDSDPEIINSIIYDNENCFAFFTNGTVSVSYSLLQTEELENSVKDNGKNIFGKDPQFAYKFKNDFSLKATSPCKKAGKSGLDMGAIR